MSRISTGIAGLDDILCGGLDPDRLYLVEGEPGTGKTTLALQFLLEGARCGEKGLYVTLSESERELRLVAKRHGWTLDGISVFELVPPEAALRPGKGIDAIPSGRTGTERNVQNDLRQGHGESILRASYSTVSPRCACLRRVHCAIAVKSLR